MTGDVAGQAGGLPKPADRRTSAAAANLQRQSFVPIYRRVQRDRLLVELAEPQSADDAAAWAHLSLPAKNTLTIEDAKIVEARFRAKLEALDGGRPEGGKTPRRQAPGLRR